MIHSPFATHYLQGPGNLSVGGVFVWAWPRAADSHTRTTHAAMISTPATLIFDIFNALTAPPPRLWFALHSTKSQQKCMNKLNDWPNAVHGHNHSIIIIMCEFLILSWQVLSAWGLSSVVMCSYSYHSFGVFVFKWWHQSDRLVSTLEVAVILTDSPCIYLIP